MNFTEVFVFNEYTINHILCLGLWREEIVKIILKCIDCGGYYNISAHGHINCTLRYQN